MKTLLAYLDFYWLENPIFVGLLQYDRLRGSDSYSFTFSDEWLSHHRATMLSADLRNFPGPQFPEAGRDVFGLFTDALPDRWGRTLIQRREQILAREEGRAVRRLSSFDYLVGIDDISRMGALRLKEEKDSEFINCTETLRIPPITSLKELTFAAQEIERAEEQNVLPEEKWIDQLLQPGTSLGGARPKANVVDEDGRLCVAKFPSRKDLYDVGLCEHWAHIMASQAGINAAETFTLKVDRHHALLSRRFDRTADGRRVHFASAMTLLGLTDGCNAASGHGYLDIVDFIIQHSASSDADLRELFRRVAFNICIGNSDDHFRNHGFLLTRSGWRLAPAYDMNPTNSDTQSLLINKDSNEANLQLLLASSDEYFIPKTEAEKIVSEVVSAVKNFRQTARRIGVSARDLDLFAERFERNF